MSPAVQHMIASNQAGLKAMEDVSKNTKAGWEKLLEINLAATQAIFGDAFSQVQSALGAHNAQSLSALQSGLFQPLTNQSAAYSHHFKLLAEDSSAKLSKQFQSKILEAQKGFATLVDQAAMTGASKTKATASTVD